MYSKLTKKEKEFLNQEYNTMGLYMKYFVLKPCGKDIYAHASREAMKKYAEIIKPENNLLANELILWINKEKLKSED